MAGPGLRALRALCGAGAAWLRWGRGRCGAGGRLAARALMALAGPLLFRLG